jgi:tetratricopeptide (TPR) repeat protein
MLVGYPGRFTATAFVISAKDRLLVTNAHVADKFYELGSMLARANGTGTTYTVDRVWCHPGVIRPHDHSLEMCCQDPSHGEVVIGSPDVAVLHLAEGPELPAELVLATPDELNDLFAQPVAMLGFPASDQQHWPATGEKLQASFRDGIINSLASLRPCGSRESREPQIVQHSIFTWFGASGAPIFLSNGHVAAINTGVTVQHREGLTREQAFGIRADCVWELIAYYHLAPRLLGPVSEAGLNLARFRNVDPYETNCHTAMALIAQCDRLMLKGDFLLAIEKCNQALLLAPGYAKALRMRSNIQREYVGTQGASLPLQRKLDLLNKASDDIRQYLKAVPTDPWGLIDACRTRIWIDWLRVGDPTNADVQLQLTRLLESGVLDPQQRAYALFVRTEATNYQFRSQADLDEAVQLAPYGLAGAAIYNSRGQLLQRYGRSTEAWADFQRADELRSAERLAAEAQETMDRPESDTKDLRQALSALLQAGRAINYGRWQHAFLIASLEHRLGDDIAATSWATKALELAPDNHKAHIRLELDGYSGAVGPAVRSTCIPILGQLPSAPPQTFRSQGVAGSAVGVPDASRPPTLDSGRRPFQVILNDN